ncbi:MAG: ral nucleoside transport system ATP-binding protein [Pseudonocardiales bacterium]|nr:ral nucleoside transport system ATP-binding protein [Pseudonocardiales bacterium]
MTLAGSPQSSDGGAGNVGSGNVGSGNVGSGGDSSVGGADLAIEVVGVTKRFPGVIANSDVNIAVRRGTVHAVVGENGAGKSTLMKVLYGMLRPDEGEIRIGGKPVTFHSPSDAIAAGVGMVHQHFMLADNFTVLENIVLGSEPTARGALNFGAARQKILALSKTYGLDLAPDELVENLGVGDRQRVEIAKVLFRGARLLILDEPTAVLVPHEVDELFDNLRELKSEGLTILFISHKLDEVISVADDITVIRRGMTVGTANPHSITPRQLAEMMVGSELPSPQTRTDTVREAVVLSVAGLTVADADGRDIVQDVSFDIRAGQVFGIAGVEGNGQSELVEALMGIRPAKSGRITLNGADLTRQTTRERRLAGIGYIPEDRQRQGLILEGSLWENRVLGHSDSPPNIKGPLIDRAGARRDTERIVREFDVRTPGIDIPALALSGGNQQKLIVGRELSGSPVLLIASQPTRGVDVGAQAAIWEQVRNARAAGLAVLLISADLEELIGMSDAIQVILRGRFVGAADPATVTAEELGSAMTGAGSAAGAA